MSSMATAPATSTSLTAPPSRPVGLFWRDRGALVAGAMLVLVAAAAWVFVVQQAAAMGRMEMATPGGTGAVSLTDLSLFLAAWGVMMAAMMLPSALPMIALYQLVSRGEPGGRVLPTVLFAASYLLIWLLVGLPVYVASAVVGALAPPPAEASWLPYGVAAVLVAAGVYQFSAFKRVCLKQCQSPLSFIMARWHSGYRATLRLGLAHAAYCVGCCWGLMAILVAAGAMSLPWVLGIAAIVFAEKLLPRGDWTARGVGALLLVLGIAVAVRPDLAVAMRGQPLSNDIHMSMMGASPAQQ